MIKLIKESIILQDLRADKRLSTPYVLPNIALTPEDSVELYKHIEASGQELRDLMDWAAQNYNNNSSARMQSLEEILPVLEDTSKSPLLTAMGVIRYFEEKKKEQDVLEKGKRRISQSLRGLKEKLDDFYNDFKGQIILGSAVIAAGIAVSAVWGPISEKYNQSKLEEQQAKAKYEQTYVKNFKSAYSLENLVDNKQRLNELKKDLTAEISFLMENRSFSEIYEDKVEERNKSINAFSNYVIFQEVPVEDAVEMVRHIWEGRNMNSTPSTSLNATVDYLMLAKENNVPYSDALGYLKSIKTGEYTPDNAIIQAAYLFTDKPVEELEKLKPEFMEKAKGYVKNVITEVGANNQNQGSKEGPN